ncbi:hypothetical protein LINPERPRIM_LOCUS19965 [Linum perenne]
MDVHARALGERADRRQGDEGALQVERRRHGDPRRPRRVGVPVEVQAERVRRDAVLVPRGDGEQAADRVRCVL